MAESQKKDSSESYADENSETEKDEPSSDEKLLKTFRECLKKQMDDEDESRKQMQDDLHFATLDQWDAAIRSEREKDPNGARPCLTIDKINQYLNQVTNDMRRNKPGVKVRPVDSEADVDTGRIIQGTVRHIEDQSSGQVAYETAGDWQVKCGLGYFRITTDYISDDSFDQEIKICRIPNMFSTYLGPHTQPDGSDADWGVIIENVPEEAFKTQYPNAKYTDDSFLEDVHIWKPDSCILVAEYFYTHYEKKTLLFLKNGESVFADKYDGDLENVSEKRESLVKEIRWCKLTGCEILERRDWAGKYIPIVEVIGKESFVDGKRMTWGLVRPAKDNLRMYNYWASSVTEKIGLSPKTPYIGAVGQFKSQGDRWDKANRVNYAKLEYDVIDVNGNAVSAPRRGEPAPIETAMIGMMQIIDRDVQTSLGMFKASVGESESQQSGRAINALQNESDTGTFHFQDNMNRSIRHAGRIIVDLIPKIMDTKRIQRILGDDGEYEQVQIDPTQKTAKRELKDTTTGKIKKIYNLGVGKYDVSISSGPSYSTKRIEAAQVFSELTRSAKDPASAAVLQYLTIKNSDITSSDEATDMLKALLPPGTLQQEGQEKIPPKAMQKMQQMSEAGQQLQQQLQEVGQENQKLKSGAQEKQAELQLKSQSMQAELQLKSQIQQAELKLEQEKAAAMIEIDRQKAQAQMEIQKMKLQFDIQSKNEEKQELMQGDQMPQIMEGLNQAFAQMGDLLQQQLAMQAETLQAQQDILLTLQKPKNVSIGKVTKDASGKITGATVNTELSFTTIQ